VFEDILPWFAAVPILLSDFAKASGATTDEAGNVVNSASGKSVEELSEGIPKQTDRSPAPSETYVAAGGTIEPDPLRNKPVSLRDWRMYTGTV